MKKTLRTVLILALAVLMLVPAVTSCGQKASTKIKVAVYIYTLEKGEDSPWMINKELEIEPGKSAFDAVVALCEARGATYTVDINGMFDSFTNADGKISAPAQEELENNMVKYYRFGWKLGDEVKSTLENPTQMKDYVLNDGDVIKVFIQNYTVEKAKN